MKEIKTNRSKLKLRFVGLLFLLLLLLLLPFSFLLPFNQILAVRRFEGSQDFFLLKPRAPGAVTAVVPQLFVVVVVVVRVLVAVR